MGHDWVAAQAAQEAAIVAAGGGEAHQGLAIALFWQNDVDGALRAMEHAYAVFRRQGEHGRAAWAALWLAGQYSRLKGHGAVAGGWIAKCERAVSRAEPSAEIGRVILVRALATNDPAEIESAAERAMEIAHRFGDFDYEALALAYSGLAMLSLGRLQEGRARIDEAMAATTAGEVRAPEAGSIAHCSPAASGRWTSSAPSSGDRSRSHSWRPTIRSG